MTKAQERTIERHLAIAKTTPLVAAIEAALIEVRRLRELCGDAFLDVAGRAPEDYQVRLLAKRLRKASVAGLKARRSMAPKLKVGSRHSRGEEVPQ